MVGCRHTFCTNAAKRGISVETLKYLMGHTDISVTSNVYTHLKLEDAQREMEPGMMFTIEPMVNMGSDEVYTDEEDDWTVRTEDGMPSAQWEVTVLVTEDGCEVICW